MGGRAQFKSLDQIMVHVGVDAWLFEGVERSASSTARNEPGLLVKVGHVMELARCPDIFAVAADKMRPGIAVGLGMNDKDLLADCSLQGIFPGQGTHSTVKDDMAGREGAHDFECIDIGIGGSLVFLELAIGILWYVKVLFSDVVDPVVSQIVALAVSQALTRKNHDCAVH